MNKVCSALLFATVVGMAPALSHAAIADFSTFSPISGPEGSYTVAPNLASISGVAALSGRVNGLSSFEWSFTNSTINDGFASFTLTTFGGASNLINLASATSGGFRKYVLDEPFSGVIRFAVDSHDTGTPATLNLRNLTVSAVPEPETFAMLLAGLGLLGWVGRRKSATASAYTRSMA